MFRSGRGALERKGPRIARDARPANQQTTNGGLLYGSSGTRQRVTQVEEHHVQASVLGLPAGGRDSYPLVLLAAPASLRGDATAQL